MIQAATFVRTLALPSCPPSFPGRGWGGLGRCTAHRQTASGLDTHKSTAVAWLRSCVGHERSFAGCTTSAHSPHTHTYLTGRAL